MNVSMWEPELGECEKTQLSDVIDSGMLTEGEKTREFERKIAELTGSKYAVATTSGGVALYLGLRALGVGPGDEVIVPDYQMIALANAVVMTGAKAVFADINCANGNIAPDHVENRITDRTKCIAIVHMNGRFADVDALKEIGTDNDVMLLEDACQGLGSFHMGKHLGTFSSVGCLSFHPSKILTTGCGGMLLTDSDDVCKRIGMFKDYGRTGRGSKELDAQVAQWGLNFRFTEMQAAIGLAQLTRLESRINRVKAIRSFYIEKLAGCKIPNSEEGYLPWVVDIQLPVAGLNLKLHENLKQKYGIETRLPYVPVHLLRPIEGRFPGAEYWSSRGLWLPTNPRLRNEELEHVVDSTNKELNIHMST